MPTPTPTPRRKDASAKDQGLVPAEESWVPAILEAVSTMRYGTLQIFVQDGSVSQIERVDRVRLEIAAKGGKRHAPR